MFPSLFFICPEYPLLSLLGLLHTESLVVNMFSLHCDSQIHIYDHPYYLELSLTLIMQGLGNDFWE